MAEPKKKSRTYHSPRRQQQASTTKTRILNAAVKQLREVGFANMKLEDIAKEAGVALQTVYGLCGSKKGVLDVLKENFETSQEYRELRFSPVKGRDPETRVRNIGHYYVAIMESGLEDYLLARTLEAVSSQYADLSKDKEKELFAMCRMVVGHMAEDGLLRQGLDVETATQMFWALYSPDIHQRLATVHGWSSSRFASWFGELVGHMLLDPAKAVDFLSEWNAESDKNRPEPREEL